MYEWQPHGIYTANLNCQVIETEHQEVIYMGEQLTVGKYMRAFQSRGRLIAEKSISGPRPTLDKVRRLMNQAEFRLGYGEQTEQALEDIFWANQQDEKENMFFQHINIDCYLRFGHLYSPELRELVEQRLKNLEIKFETGTENHKLMFAVSGYLTAQTWKDWECSAEILKLCADYLCSYFDKTCRYGQGEFNATTYSLFYLTTLMSLYDFAEDSSMRQKAAMMLCWFFTSVANNWLSGYYVGAHTRDYHPLSGTEDPGCGSIAAWLYFGGRKPEMAQSNEPHYCSICMNTGYRIPFILIKTVCDRTYPYIQRESEDFTALMAPTHDQNETHCPKGSDEIKGWGYISRAGVFKYTYMNTGYALGSMTNGIEGDVISCAQQRRWSLDWDSDQPGSVFFSTHPLPDFPETNDAYHTELMGSSPYEQVFQDKETLLALYRIPCNLTCQAAPGRLIRSDICPYVDCYFSASAILKLEEDESGWIFCHGGSVLFAVHLFNPYHWLDQKQDVKSYNNRLRIDGTHQILIIETQSPDKYSTAEDLSPQKYANELKMFRQDILLNTKIIDVNLEQVSIQYQNLSGKVLAFSYDGSRIVDGEEQFVMPYPLIETPFVHSEIGSGIVQISHGSESLTLDYNTWSMIQESAAPMISNDNPYR